MRIALGLEYDGRGFCGWQSQPAGCGAQDALQQALSRVSEQSVAVHAAGRTDAGVHALTQVVHFDTMAVRPIGAWVRGVNAFLPAGLRVLWAHPVEEGFHARFSAERRSYQYLLVNRPVAPAILQGKAGWFYLPLDEAAMSQAAACLVGEHDFSAFRAAECQARSPVKQLFRADVRRLGDNILFDFCAGAFLHHQVRNMVGALVYVGKGKYPPGWMTQLLASRDRKLAPPTFAPDGLYLTGVGYDARWGLPASQRSLSEMLLPLG
jgi:tRNA pseudouridine38-40 synthase